MTNYTQLVPLTPKDALVTGDPLKRILGAQYDAEFSAISAAISSKENSANKNLANGYCPLDSSGLVPAANIPASAGATTGSFTGTLTGMTTTTTAAVNYSIRDGLVSMWVNGDFLGTSNSTAMTMTGLPAAVQPTGNVRQVYGWGIDNNGQASVIMTVSPGSGTAVFKVLSQVFSGSLSQIGFTASSTKGLSSSATLGFYAIYPV